MCDVFTGPVGRMSENGVTVDELARLGVTYDDLKRLEITYDELASGEARSKLLNDKRRSPETGSTSAV